jgi:flagellar hook-associated protein 3 FlgL
VAVSRFESIVQSVNRAADELSAADGALDGVGNVMSRARELAVQLSNSTYSVSERASAATEVNGLLQQTLGLLNTRVGNRYIFGGTLDSAAPFDSTGNYSGDGGVRQVEIAPGVVQNASVRADIAVKGVGGGTDVIATLTALSTALLSNNVAGVQATLSGFDAGITQVATARSGAGSAMSVLDAAAEAGRAGKLAEETTLSHLADADAIEAASRLALAERALDASLTASARSFRLTLLDKL